MDIKDLTHPLKVIEKIQETYDTYSFVFDIPEDQKHIFKYKAGQFVSFFLNVNGQDVNRSYSLASSPVTDSKFKVSVKRVSGGLVSNYLIDEINVGDVLQSTPPAGLFTLPKENTSKECVFFAGGSGITPVISIIKTSLATDPANKCRMLYACRNEDSIIFHRELKELNQKYPEQFKYEYILSQPKKAFDGMTGRLHGPQVKEFLERNDCSKEAFYFLCGPDGFMHTAEAALELFGVERSHIIKESFTPPSSSNAPALEGAVTIGNKDSAAAPRKLIVELDGETIEVDAVDGQSVLETLLEKGHNPPYSCMDGACMACMGKVTEGLVYQEDMGILTEDNTEVGECLTCQAKPASDVVRVSYEI